MNRILAIFLLAGMMGCADKPFREESETITVLDVNWDADSVIALQSSGNIKAFYRTCRPIMLWPHQKFFVTYHYDENRGETGCYVFDTVMPITGDTK